jgi:hypothetical protein
LGIQEVCVSTVTEALAAEVPAARGGDEQEDPERVARGEPIRHDDGVPVYGSGQAPAYLRSKTQLAGERLKLAEGQRPEAYVVTRDYGDVALYDPKGAVKMRPLPSSTKAKMAARRTCRECGKVRKEILKGRPCTVCRERAARARERLLARTCADCGTVRERPYPKAHRRCQGCRRAQLAELRRRAEEWLARVTICAGDGCSVKVVTKKEARAHQKAQNAQGLRMGLRTWWYRAKHWPERCPPCAEVYELRRAKEQAEMQARYEREERERREAERRAAEERQRWAAAALTDPDVVILDTETTGLHAEARIVELAVISSRGEVLLDTLLNPGEPIPGDASDIHGITDSDVAGAPAFSDVLVKLTGLLDGKRCLIYNAVYDVNRLRHELTLHYLDRSAKAAADEVFATGVLPDGLRERSIAEGFAQAAAWIDAMHFEDVMIPYSDWVGDWSDYHGNNRWQPLNGGHRALGDCRAVIDCLRAMAAPDEDETDLYETAAAGAGGWGEGTDG